MTRGLGIFQFGGLQIGPRIGVYAYVQLWYPFSIIHLKSVIQTMMFLLMAFFMSRGMARIFYLVFAIVFCSQEEMKCFLFPVTWKCGISIKSSYTCNTVYYCYWPWPHWLITGWPPWQLPTDFASWVISSNLAYAVGVKEACNNSPSLEYFLLYWH